MMQIPNFFHLQQHSRKWEKIINASETYGSELRSTKEIYDTYIDALLDDHLTSSKFDVDVKELTFLMRSNLSLTDPSDGEPRQHLSTAGAENDLVKEKEQQITLLREEIEASVKRNTRLRAIIDGLRTSIGNYEKVSQVSEIGVCSNEVVVEALQTKIELKANDIDRMREHLKKNFVAVTMHQRLEDCIKEIEVDAQRLWKQNEFLEKNVEELEDELDNVLIKTGIKAKGGAKLWKKMDTTKIIDS
jgi:hypothetical protein